MKICCWFEKERKAKQKKRRLLREAGSGQRLLLIHMSERSRKRCPQSRTRTWSAALCGAGSDDQVRVARISKTRTKTTVHSPASYDCQSLQSPESSSYTFMRPGGCGRVAPPTGRVAPPTGRVAPPTGRVAPPTGRVAPPTGNCAAPLNSERLFTDEAEPLTDVVWQVTTEPDGRVVMETATVLNKRNPEYNQSFHLYVRDDLVRSRLMISMFTRGSVLIGCMSFRIGPLLLSSKVRLNQPKERRYSALIG
ncbi:uncharacterized protein V6R79_006637 [Siganus canaliculatus]